MFINLAKPPETPGHDALVYPSESAQHSHAVPRPVVSKCDRAWVAGLFDRLLKGRDKARSDVSPKTELVVDLVSYSSPITSDTGDDCHYPPPITSLTTISLPQAINDWTKLSPAPDRITKPRKHQKQKTRTPYCTRQHTPPSKVPRAPPKAVTVFSPKLRHENTDIMTDKNPYAILGHGRDDIFRGLYPYLTAEELGPMLGKFKRCLMDNETPDERLEAIRTSITPMQFVSGPMVKEDRLYTTLRAALGRYGISCSTDLANGAPVWKKLVKLLWPLKFEAVCDAVKARMARNGASPAKSAWTTVGPSGLFNTDVDDEGDHGLDEDDEMRTPPSPPKLPTSPKEVATPGNWKYDEVIDNLVANFNSRLDQELQITTDDLIEKVTTRIEARLNLKYALSPGQASKEEEEGYVLPGPIGESTPPPAPASIPGSPAPAPSSDRALPDTNKISPKRDDDEDHGPTKHSSKIHHQFDGNNHQVSIVTPMTKSTEDPETWNPDLPYHLKSSEQRYAEDQAQRAGKAQQKGGDEDRPKFWGREKGQGAIGPGGNRDAQGEDTDDDPNKIMKREEDDEVEAFLHDEDAPSYKNDSSTVLKRKQDAAKSISLTFQNQKFGGTGEKDWEQHKSDYEAIALDYQLRSKDLAYFLRLTLCDQALSLHRSLFPSKVKTYPRLCEQMEIRFDRRTKRETNSKALLRLTYDKFLKEAHGSPLKDFNSLVLRIEKLSAVATPDQKTDRAKISVLMNAIERTHWFITATSGTEAIEHFTGVVEKINHELTKQALNNPGFVKEDQRSSSDKMRIVRDILLNVGEEIEDGDGEGEQEEEEEQAGEQDVYAETAEHGIMFGGQRRYGIHPNKHRRRNGRNHGYRNNYNGGNQHRHGGNQRYGHDGKRNSPSNTYDRRCFNCGGPGCTVATCKEPRNQTRIEANIAVWRRTKNITRPLRRINLADIDSPSYLIAEVMAAEIYLEHAASANDSSNSFFGTSSGVEPPSNTLDWSSSKDHTIFLTNVDLPEGKHLDNMPLHVEIEDERTCVEVIPDKLQELDFQAHDDLEPSGSIWDDVGNGHDAEQNLKNKKNYRVASSPQTRACTI